jgi:hypothetical protein
MRGRYPIALVGFLAGLALAAPAGAQHVGLTATPPSPVSEGTQVAFQMAVLPGAPAGTASFRLEVRREGSGTLVHSQPAADNEYGPASRFEWPARPAGTYMIIAKVQFQAPGSAVTESTSIRNFVVLGSGSPPPPLAFQFLVTPPTGATTETSVKLEARLGPGQSRPADVHCIFETLPSSGTLRALASPACDNVQTRLAAGTWTLRLVVYRGSPRQGPTLGNILATLEKPGYQVTAVATSTASCASGCERVGGICVAPRGAACGPGRTCLPGYSCAGGTCIQTASSAGPVISCRQDNQCPPGTRCFQGQCRRQQPPRMNFACNVNADCSGGNVCAGGECRRRCQ